MNLRRLLNLMRGENEEMSNNAMNTTKTDNKINRKFKKCTI